MLQEKFLSDAEVQEYYNISSLRISFSFLDRHHFYSKYQRKRLVF